MFVTIAFENGKLITNLDHVVRVWLDPNEDDAVITFVDGKQVEIEKSILLEAVEKHNGTRN